jgi:hypothetical protein
MADRTDWPFALQRGYDDFIKGRPRAPAPPEDVAGMDPRFLLWAGYALAMANEHHARRKAMDLLEVQE